MSLHKRLYNLPSFGKFSQNTSPFFILKQLAFSVIEVFRSIHVLPYIYQFWQWVSCTIFQIKSNFLTGQQNIYYFAQKTLHTSFIFKENQGSPSESPPETFSFQVFNITNKYHFPDQSAKNLYFHPRDFTYLLYISPYRRFQDPVEHLKWIFQQKQLTATQENNSIIFAKSSILDSSIFDVRMRFKDAFDYFTRF